MRFFLLVPLLATLFLLFPILEPPLSIPIHLPLPRLRFDCLPSPSPSPFPFSMVASSPPLPLPHPNRKSFNLDERKVSPSSWLKFGRLYSTVPPDQRIKDISPKPTPFLKHFFDVKSKKLWKAQRHWFRRRVFASFVCLYKLDASGSTPCLHFTTVLPSFEFFCRNFLSNFIRPRPDRQTFIACQPLRNGDGSKSASNHTGIR